MPRDYQVDQPKLMPLMRAPPMRSTAIWQASPNEEIFAIKPRLANALLEDAHSRGSCTAFVSGDGGYAGPGARRGIRRAEWAIRASQTFTIWPHCDRGRLSGQTPTERQASTALDPRYVAGIRILALLLLG